MTLSFGFPPINAVQTSVPPLKEIMCDLGKILLSPILVSLNKGEPVEPTVLMNEKSSDISSFGGTDNWV